MPSTPRPATSTSTLGTLFLAATSSGSSEASEAAGVPLQQLTLRTKASDATLSPSTVDSRTETVPTLTRWQHSHVFDLVPHKPKQPKPHLESHPPAFIRRVALELLTASIVPVVLTSLWSAVVCAVGASIKDPFPNSQSVTIVLGISLSLLLAFRLNTANDRFWEGCKVWYAVKFHCLNLSRMVSVMVTPATQEGLMSKRCAIDLLPAFAFAVRHELRGELGDPNTFGDMAEYLVHFPHVALNPTPMNVLLELQRYLADCDQSVLAMHNTIVSLSDQCAILERIRHTPIPAAYSLHLSNILFFYLAALPFQLYPQMGWFAVAASAIVSFVMLGITAISVAIEDPFGDDLHDLPTDVYCQDIAAAINEAVDLRVPSHPKGSSMGWDAPKDI
ncbi:hypothetical protein HDU79_008979 [Rhizoclosmatium sp. JEL0117]|nr:hypothetical protein HDU79_008979 [Rhizoclosmatium sp. JEL0117]